MIFATGLASIALGVLFTALYILLTILRFFFPPVFVLPNGLQLQNPTFDIRRLDVVANNGRILELRNDWACFDDRTVYLSGPSGSFAVDAEVGQVLSIRPPTNTDERLCGSAGYFTGLTSHDLFLPRSLGLPCEWLNPNLDRFAQAQRFRALCRSEEGLAPPTSR